MAVGFNRAPVVGLLLDAGADLEARDAAGNTVLHYAAGEARGGGGAGRGDMQAGEAGERGTASELQPEKLQPKKLQPKKLQPEKLQPEKLQPEKLQPAEAESYSCLG